MRGEYTVGDIDRIEMWEALRKLCLNKKIMEMTREIAGRR